jgi:hypothetical protein
LREVSAAAETSTANVVVLPVENEIERLAPGATATVRVRLLVQKSFVPGTPIELALHVFQGSPFGLSTLRLTLPTGTPTATTLLAENFDEVEPGALPTGWIAVHGAGANAVPWTTSSSFCGAKSNGAFHADAIDGATPTADPTRWERLLSPVVAIPADNSNVTLEFDVCYDTEDDPLFRILGFDGFFLRIFDATTGRLARSVLVDAFESKFTTGDVQGYVKHLPRSGNPAYFQDMSVWGGDSSGLRHVKLTLPGMAGSRVQLRWEYTQDSNGTCADVRPGHACGVLVDNIVMSSVKLGGRP